MSESKKDLQKQRRAYAARLKYYEKKKQERMAKAISNYQSQEAKKKPAMEVENVAPIKAEAPTSPKKMKLTEETTITTGELQLKWKKLVDSASAPKYGSDRAAGADLCSAEDCVVPARGKYLVSTGISIAVPPGYYGRVAPRSGLAVKNFIDVGAGVIDEDYRGEVKVLLFNFSDQDFQVKTGDRIAQLVCEQICRPEVKEVEELDDTQRGHGGFGSTGVSNA
uniref:Deoxyuridine 5'-triphosphate nucleotidohydrolase n=1 Tax=Acrobeloides nanus TaxID=290746 RepID=A0A914CI99_9BILA